MGPELLQDLPYKCELFQSPSTRFFFLGFENQFMNRFLLKVGENNTSLSSKIAFDQPLLNKIVKESLLRKADMKGINQRVTSIIKEKKAFIDQMTPYEINQLLELQKQINRGSRDHELLRHIVKKNLQDKIPIISQREPLIRMTLLNLIGLEICKIVFLSFYVQNSRKMLQRQ